LAGSRWLLWSYGLVALLTLIAFGRVSLMSSLILGTWLPLPLLLVGWRLGTLEAALLAFMGVLFVFALNPGMAAFQDNLGLWMLMLMGQVLAVCHQRDWPDGSAIMFAVLFLGFLSLVFFLGQAFLQGLGPTGLWEKKSQELAESLTKMMGEAGVGMSDLRVMGLPRLEIQHMLIQVLPALVLINLALVAWVNVLVAQKLGGLWGWNNLGEPLSLWASPEWLVFVLVAAGFSLLAPFPGVRQAGLNLVLVLGFVYFCQGVAVISALLQRFNLPWVLRILVYILSFMNPLLIVVMILGLTDLWLDFRRLQPPQET
jgi:uncharacterized protein YybS (DUF2232 family)